MMDGAVAGSIFSRPGIRWGRKSKAPSAIYAARQIARTMRNNAMTVRAVAEGAAPRIKGPGARLFRPCMGPSLSRANSSFHCSFSVRLRRRFLRPDLRLRWALCGARVKGGRSPPPEAARSVLDAVEHGANLVMPRRTIGIAIRPEGSSPCAPRCFAWQPCIRPIPVDRYHDADIRIGGEAPSGGPILQERHQGHGRKRDTATSDRYRQYLLREQTSAEPSVYLLPSYAVAGAVRFRPPDAAACRGAPCRWRHTPTAQSAACGPWRQS